MPNLTLKEAIEVLKFMLQVLQEPPATTPLGIKNQEALSFAISKLSLLEAVENMGGVEKDQLQIASNFCLLQPCAIKEDEATGSCYGCKIGSSIKNTWDKALVLCQADLVRRLEGITQNLEDISKYAWSGDKSRMNAIGRIADETLTHLTTPERTQGEGA